MNRITGQKINKNVEDLNNIKNQFYLRDISMAVYHERQNFLSFEVYKKHSLEWIYNMP